MGRAVRAREMGSCADLLTRLPWLRPATHTGRESRGRGEDRVARGEDRGPAEDRAARAGTGLPSRGPVDLRLVTPSGCAAVLGGSRTAQHRSRDDADPSDPSPFLLREPGPPSRRRPYSGASGPVRRRGSWASGRRETLDSLDAAWQHDHRQRGRSTIPTGGTQYFVCSAIPSVGGGSSSSRASGRGKRIRWDRHLGAPAVSEHQGDNGRRTGGG